MSTVSEVLDMGVKLRWVEVVPLHISEFKASHTSGQNWVMRK